MPLKIVKDDIRKIKCDAIVCGDISSDDILDIGKKEIKLLRKMASDYVINIKEPSFNSENENEQELLKSYYSDALKIAKSNRFESVAISFVSLKSDFLKDKVLNIAINSIKEFINENDILVYLVLTNKAVYSLNKNLDEKISKYINDNYIDIDEEILDEDDEVSFSINEKISLTSEKENDDVEFFNIPRKVKKTVPKFGSVYNFKELMTKSFRDTLLELIDEKGISDVECYKNANVSRQTWHKIISSSDFSPKKRTVISFAISLKLNLEETQKLLATVGYILSKSSLFDVIIMCCITNGIYDIFEIDAILFQYDQKTLFSSD